MTNGEPTPFGAVEIRAREAEAAGKVMGVGRSLLGLKNREVVHDLSSRHKLAALIRVHRPDWMFVPYPIDAHPDHVAVSKIAEDGRFDAKLSKSSIVGEPWHPKRIIYYFCTHLRMNFVPTFCIDISAQMELKVKAVGCYESQFKANAAGDVPSMVETLDGCFGGGVGSAHAGRAFSYVGYGFSGVSQV